MIDAKIAVFLGFQAHDAGFIACRITRRINPAFLWETSPSPLSELYLLTGIYFISAAATFISGPEMSIPGPGMNVSGPEMDIAGPGMNVSSLEMKHGRCSITIGTVAKPEIPSGASLSTKCGCAHPNKWCTDTLTGRTGC